MGLRVLPARSCRILSIQGPQVFPVQIVDAFLLGFFHDKVLEQRRLIGR